MLSEVEMVLKVRIRRHFERREREEEGKSQAEEKENICNVPGKRENRLLGDGKTIR